MNITRVRAKEIFARARASQKGLTGVAAAQTARRRENSGGSFF